MQGHRNIITFHIPGTLTANINMRFTAAYDFRVKEVSAVASNASDASLEVGISSDVDSILATYDIGDSDVPIVKKVADFASTNSDGIVSAGEIFVLTLDFDGAVGVAGQNVTIVVSILEG